MNQKKQSALLNFIRDGIIINTVNQHDHSGMEEIRMEKKNIDWENLGFAYRSEEHNV